jgi:dehydration protein DpgD
LAVVPSDTTMTAGPTGDEPRVRYDKRGQVAYITLNRPAVLNAMDRRMHQDLAAVWDDFDADEDIRVGVLTGAGKRAFSVGQDLGELAGRIREGIDEPSGFGSRGKPGWPRLTERFDLTKPVIAKVRGYALGGGFELALACDIIIASQDATFALPEARLGLIAGAGGVFRLTRQLPFKTAMGYLMTGRSLTANRAFDLGLVNEVTSVEDLDGCVDGWVHDILECAPLAVRAIKEVASTSATMALPEAFAAGYEWEDRRRHSNDAREGVLAFAAKRAPRWSGR